MKVESLLTSQRLGCLKRVAARPSPRSSRVGGIKIESALAVVIIRAVMLMMDSLMFLRGSGAC